jgi:hypothetical protein
MQRRINGLQHCVRFFAVPLFQGCSAIAWLAVALLAACGGGGDAPPAPAAPPLQVVIFAGQSNMAGADAIISPSRTEDLADTGQQTDADRSARFTSTTMGLAYQWGDIRGHRGASLGETTVNGKPVKVHGPEVGFSRSIGHRVAIIKFADNFTALENGRSPWVAPGSRWRAWQAFVDGQLATLGEPYKVVGFVWQQGIDDALLQRDGAAYEADLRQVAADLRARFGPLPFVLARSVNSPIAGGAAMAPIRAAQVAVGESAGNAWIDVDDLGPFVNAHHLTAAAQLVAGRRFAEAMHVAAP